MEPKNGKPETPEDRKMELFLHQKQTLDTFLEHGAITKQQYDKSFGDLKIKMGITGETGETENGKKN